MTPCVLILVFAMMSVTHSSILSDIINTIYGLPVAFQDCSKIAVDATNIKFTLYTDFWYNGGAENDSILDTNVLVNRTIIIAHGWIEDGLAEWILEMKNTYLKRIFANIIVVDWSFYSKTNYGAAFCAVPGVGRAVGNFIYKLATQRNIALLAIQINGFSLGAQVAGYAGQTVKERTGGYKIGRINGLDAAGPGYLGLPASQRLDATDADFVQGIHTGNWEFGYSYSYATTDFHINSVLIGKCGVTQPGCPLEPVLRMNETSSLILNKLKTSIFCNHFRAVVYFIQSIASMEFVGIECQSCSQFILGQCKSNTTAVMGEHCPKTANGTFYLNTNSSLNFSQFN